MRRKNKEITDIKEIMDIMSKCEMLSLGLFDGEYPYVIPMNFGFVNEDGKIKIYFHCAQEGRKIDIIKNNNKAAFECTYDCKLISGDRPCKYTMKALSVCGKGRLTFVEDEEKKEAFKHIMKQYSKTEFEFTDIHVKNITILRLDVIEIVGKRV